MVESSSGSLVGMEIRADREVCIGAGNCSLTAPELFDQDEEDDLVRVLRQPQTPEEFEAAREAVEQCPSGALSLSEEGEQ
jgi:ferredoxin